MKDAHKILIEYGIKQMGQQIVAFEVEKLIKNAQKDAYNQAIEDVFEYQLLNGCLESNEDMINNLKIK